MPLGVKPRLVGITGQGNKNKHAVSFTYDFVADVPVPINIGGIAFTGSSYTLDVSSLASNVADLPAFRTLLLTCSFDNSTSDVFDGELVVAVSGTDQIMRFSQGLISSPDVGSVCILTAQVPIVANAPTKIQFAKGRNNGGAMFGMLTASIYDFDLAPFVSLGFANDAN